MSSPIQYIQTLTVGCTAGLSNRLKVLASGLALAEASGRSFQMFWPRTTACSASFTELFANTWNVQEGKTTAVEKLTNCTGERYDCMPDFLESSERDLSAQAFDWLLQPRRFSGHSQLESHCRKIFDILQPLPEIEQRIASFRAGHFKLRMIGVHLRRGDMRRHQPDIAANTNEAIVSVEEILHRMPDAGILLCTDDGAVIYPSGRATRVEGVRAKFKKRFGHRVVWTTPRSLDRGEPAAIQDALVDLWLLRATDAVVGTHGSAFSDLAAYGREIPVVRCKSATLRYRLLERTCRLAGIPHLVARQAQVYRRFHQDVSPALLPATLPLHMILLRFAKRRLDLYAPTWVRLINIWRRAPTSYAIPTSPSGVIIYLVRSSEGDVSELVQSLTLLKANFLDRFPHPVVLFIEADFKEEWRTVILSGTGLACRFETVEMALPDFLDPEKVPLWVLEPKFDLGYRHMCRFFSGLIYQHPALMNFKWYWRLDTDSLVLGPVRYDVFAFMERRNLIYGYNAIAKENETVAVGLWDLTQQHLKKYGIQPFFLNKFVRNGKWNRSLYYTNFEISRFDFWRSESFNNYFNAIDRSGGIYHHRWGDSIIHALAVSIFVPRRKVHRFKDIHYQHQGFINYSNPVKRLGRQSWTVCKDVIKPVWKTTRRWMCRE